MCTLLREQKYFFVDWQLAYFKTVLALDHVMCAVLSNFL